MQARTSARIAAASIAAIAWAGLVIQFIASYQATPSVTQVLWIILAYFTITTNFLVALVFTAIALGVSRFGSAPVVAGVMLAILLVGIIYALLLRGTLHLTGLELVPDTLNHMVTPYLVPLFWIAFTPKGTLRPRHPLLWAIYPLAYLGYALLRGSATGQYAYPFLDVLKLGPQRTAINCTAIAIAFLLCGYLVVWLDRALARRSAQDP